MFGTRKLGKTSTQRRAMLRQQVTDLLENGKMETTFYRAKEIQPVVEKMITLGKKADLASYRRALGRCCRDGSDRAGVISEGSDTMNGAEFLHRFFAFCGKAEETVDKNTPVERHCLNCPRLCGQHKKPPM